MYQDFIFQPTPDRREALVSFDPREQELLEESAKQLKSFLIEGDEIGATSVLFPPAYGDDFMRQVEYDRLVKTELSNSHLAALDTLLEVVHAERVTADQIEMFLRAVNQIRLVFAKPLELTDDTHDGDFPSSHPMHDAWNVYVYFGLLQNQALEALSMMAADLPE